MTFVVAFDGSDLSEAALAQAGKWAEYGGQDVVAVTVVPGDSLYAKRAGWVASEAAFDPVEVAERLEAQVAAVDDDARFRPVRVDAYAGPRTIAKAIRRAAREADAEVVFLGSENAGRIVSPVSSVGDKVAQGTDYDVHIVRTVE